MTTWRRVAAVPTAIVLAVAACTVERQIDRGPPSYRLVSVNRAQTGESHVSVQVTFGVGEFQLTPADGILYRASLNYDERRFSPVMKYDAEDGDLVIGIQAEHFGRNMNLSDQRLDVALGRGVPMDLALELGASKSTIELGGLSLTELTIATGASQTTAAFSSPNRAACDKLTVHAGAAELTMTGLANARCRRIEFAGGAGDFTFDLTGAWGDLTDIDMEMKMGVGEVTLVFQEDIGVAVDMDKFLVRFEGSSFRQEGRVRYSGSYETATKRVHVHLSAALGSLTVRWVAPQ